VWWNYLHNEIAFQFELDDSSNEDEDEFAIDGGDEDSFPLPDFDFDSLIGAATGGEENVGQVGQRVSDVFFFFSLSRFQIKLYD
jgi:hypothetical protein